MERCSGWQPLPRGFRARWSVPVNQLERVLGELLDGLSTRSCQGPAPTGRYRKWNVTWLLEGVPVTTVLICDDRRSVREGLTRVMSAVPGVSRIDCVAHGDELLARFTRQPVDVVLVGTQRAVPTGVEATRRLVSANPPADGIADAAPDDPGSVAADIAGGARGYLRWDASRPELVAALAHTLASTSVPAPRQPSDPGVQLTDRELQVLRGMSQGKSNGQIGRELYLSEDTVKTHARRLFRKLGVRDRAQAVAHGFRRGLVSWTVPPLFP